MKNIYCRYKDKHPIRFLILNLRWNGTKLKIQLLDTTEYQKTGKYIHIIMAYNSWLKEMEIIT